MSKHDDVYNERPSNVLYFRISITSVISIIDNMNSERRRMVRVSDGNCRWSGRVPFFKL